MKWETCWRREEVSEGMLREIKVQAVGNRMKMGEESRPVLLDMHWA